MGTSEKCFGMSDIQIDDFQSNEKEYGGCDWGDNGSNDYGNSGSDSDDGSGDNMRAGPSSLA